MLTSTVFADLIWAAIFVILLVVINTLNELTDSPAVSLLVSLPMAVVLSAATGYFTLSAAVRAFTPVILQSQGVS